MGTPDDLVGRIEALQEITGGFGTVVGFVHDWANREDTLRSWDLVARYVIPKVNGLLAGYHESNRYVVEHRDAWNRAGAAVISKIAENERAVAAVQEPGPKAPSFIPDVSAAMGEEIARQAAGDGDGD